MPRTSGPVDAAGVLSAPLLGPEPGSEQLEPLELVEAIGGGSGSSLPTGASVSRPASPGPLSQEVDSELEQPPEPEPRASEDAGGGSSAPAPPSRRRRALLALALAVALVSPIVLPYGLFKLFQHREFSKRSAGEVCPFVPIDPAAQKNYKDVIHKPLDERASALRNLDNGTLLQLLRDVDNGLFTETWIASAPIALRNSFLAWLAAKLFFTATELQPARGLMGMAVAGHGARRSVVGDHNAGAAGWQAIVGDTSSVDMATAMKVWGWPLVAFCVAGGAIAIASTQKDTIWTDTSYLILWTAWTACALCFALPTVYFKLRGFYTSTQVNHQQATWEEAKLALGLTMRQASGVSAAKLLLWHWSQPFAYLLVFERYFGCSHFMDYTQQVLGSIVAARELMYIISTVVAVFVCPVYLLLDVQTVLQEAETRFERFYRLSAYLIMPHNVVSLCLANRSAELQLIFLPLALFQVIADFASCFALGPLLLDQLLFGKQSPVALKIGYTITSVGFVGFFGPLTVLSLLRTARDKAGGDGKESSGRVTRACAAVSALMLGLGLLYVIVGFVLAAFGVDVVCGWFKWFWFMCPTAQ